MKPEKIIINTVLCLFCILSPALSAYGQTETGIINNNAQKKEAVTSKKTTTDADKNKTPLKDIPKNNSQEKKETVPAVIDKSAGKDNKKTETKAADKDSAAKKDEKKPEVWDDTKKAEKISSTLDYGMQKDRKTAIIMIDLQTVYHSE